MNKQMRFLGIAALAMVALLLPLNAEAVCGSISFGAYYTEISNTNNTSTLRSSFWMVGGGNPAVGSGNDNGAIADSGGATGQWVVPYGDSFGILGNWGDFEYDGCADALGDTSIQRMAVAVSDVVGGVPMYAAACTDRDPSAGIQFRFDFPVGCENDPPTCVDMPLVPVPKPVVTSTTRAGNEANITIAAPSFAAGFKTDGSVGCELNTVVPQYDVYKQQIARDTPPNATRDAGAAWVLVGTGNAGAPFSFATNCAASNCDIYLAVAPKYANGFTTSDPAQTQPARVGANSVKLQAGPILADPPKPRRIENKKSTQ